MKEQLTVQIRTVELGIPTLVLLQDYAQVVLEPSQINVSDDASVATRVTFPSPIYLQGGEEYVWFFYNLLRTTMKHGLVEWVNQQLKLKVYLMQKVLLSQNNTLVVVYLNHKTVQFGLQVNLKILKFTLYKADFSKSRDSEVIFYNPELNYESSLIPNLGITQLEHYLER